MYKFADYFNVSEAFIRGETLKRKFNTQSNLDSLFIDHSIEIMFKNICTQCDEQTRNIFYKFLIYIQRFLNYDSEITCLF